MARTAITKNELVANGLLDFANFAMVWDDCGPNDLMPTVQNYVRPLLRSILPVEYPLCFAVYWTWGWIGPHEDKHATCLLSNLPTERLRLLNDTLASIVPLVCA